MEITGRITKDATIYKVKSDKEVVNFSIAINNSYKPKNSFEVKEITTYIDCSYCLSAKIPDWLKKGALVQLFGRIGLNVYSSSDDKALGSLTFHTNNIKILAFAKKTEQTQTEITPQSNKGVKQEPADDLPF